VLRWSPDECRERWARGAALILDASPGLAREPLEPLFERILDAVAALGDDKATGVGRFAQAWDAGQLSPSTLLERSRKESARGLQGSLGIPADLLSLVTYLGLRPPLEAYFAVVQPAFSAELWDSGGCPFCAAPPAFGDIGEDGKRWLCCALCGARWTIGRLRCPLCGNRNAKTLTRLAAEGSEEGYLIEACDACRGYLKGVDRRVRWNAASPLIEDWGTPHLDLIGRRKGYWRATPHLICLTPRSA
jgi:FdhE protein